MPAWRRTLYTVWVTQFIGVAGFSFIMPFIPYYIQELGISDTEQVALWAGLVTAAQAVSMAIMAPVWGALSDRYGRKLMVLRASFAGAVVLSLMGFVTNVWQLLILRFVQGMLTGTVSATTTLVASQAPKDRAGAALGSLQTAIFLGVSFGPLIGGVSGDAFGFRPSFWITGGLLALSGVLVFLFVHEDFHPAADAPRVGRGGTRTAIAIVVGSGALLAVLAGRILLRIGTRALDPVLPLFVQSLLPAGAQVGTTTGLIAAGAALGAAVGSPLIGGWGDRFGRRRMLLISAVAAALLYVPQAFVTDARWLVAWQILSGFAVGGTLATITALLSEAAPHGHEGIVFGLDASAVSGASAIGPVLGAAVASQLGLRAPFLLATVMFVIGATAVWLWVRDPKRQAAALVVREE
jgi:MFS transporter, DHA1 family, multidrug resistance protein